MENYLTGRFQMLFDDYEQEQEELREKLLRLNEEITNKRNKQRTLTGSLAKRGNISP
mgnify:CR=1 FL=1